MTEDVPRRFGRPTQGRWLAGVCAGLSRTFGIDVAAVRIVFALTPAVSVPVYIVLWIFTDDAERLR